MAIAQLILKYFRVLFSAPVIIGALALLFIIKFKPEIKNLIKHIATIRLPGGGELTTSQIEKSIEAPNKMAGTNPKPADEQTVLEEMTLSVEDQKLIRELFEAERARAAIWEYRYLNYYLAHNSQVVLDWLAKLQPPPTVELADTFMQQIILSVDERKAIMEALRTHYLVDIQNNQLIVTPKGKEYIQWRGPITSKTE
ncbi:MAG: hypothetical protein R3F48_07760 [Candidatus Zixiibacteriota bacterium]